MLTRFRLAWIPLAATLSVGVPCTAQVIQHFATSGTTQPALEPGSPAGSYALSGFDDVNIYNGNLNLVLPLHRVEGRGEAGYTMNLVWPSARWSASSYSVPSTSQQGAIIGWSHIIYGFGYSAADLFTPRYSPGSVHIKRFADGLNTCTGSDVFQRTHTSIVYVDSSGTEHTLYGAHQGISQNSCSSVPFINRGATFESLDRSITFVSTFEITDVTNPNDVFSPANPADGKLYFSNGIVYEVSQSRITKITDRNGNTVTISYTQIPSGFAWRPSQITDSQGRVITISDCTATSSGVCESITFPGYQAADRTIRVYWAPWSGHLRQGYSAATPLFFETGSPLSASSYAIPVPTAVELPNGRSYIFKYNPYGEVARVELPTGGAIEYDYTAGLTGGAANGAYTSGQVLSIYPSAIYASGEGSSNLPWYPFVYRRLSERRVYLSGATITEKTVFERPEAASNPVTWPNTSYVSNLAISYLGKFRVKRGLLNTITSDHTFISDTLGNTTIGGPALNMKSMFPGTDTPQIVIAVPFNNIGSEITSTISGYRRVERVYNNTAPFQICQVLTTLLDGAPNKTRAENYYYDSYFRRADVYEQDYGAAGGCLASPPSAYLRRTNTIYSSDANYVSSSTGRHIRNLVTQQTVYGPQGTVASQTSYVHDETPRATGNTISWQDPGSDYRGNTTTIKRLSNSTAPAVWLTSTLTYDQNGNVLTKTDPPPAVTNPPTPGPKTTLTYGECNGAAPSEIKNPLDHRTKYTYDCNIGRPKKVEREYQTGSFASTEYEFDDLLDRFTKVTRPDGGTTSYAYSDAVRTVTTTTQQKSCGSTTDSVVTTATFDQLGRLYRTETADNPGGSNTKVDRTYDEHGRLKGVSLPYRNSSQVIDHSYDPLDRLRVVTYPDSSKRQNLYSLDKTTVDDETTFSDNAKQLFDIYRDARGRIWKAVEYSNTTTPSSTGYETTYTYDALDNLRTVTQGDRAARTFTYNVLGQLTETSQPESGTTSFTYYGTGTLHTKTDASGTITHAYDALERLIEKTYSGSTTSKATLFYDTCDKGLGLLCGGAAYDPANTATVIGSFGYGYDDNGRIVSSTQTTNGAAYQFGYTYNAAGTPETITYPAMSGRVVTYCYDKGGRPKDVINGTVSGSSKYATDITYAENGGLASMKSNNVGTVWTQTAWTYDPSRQRPSAINISRNGSTLLKLEYFFCPSLGQSCTVNNGNLVSARITRGSTIWNQSYGYDSFNRLKTGTETALPGLTGWSLTDVYDRYGNRGVLSSSTPAPDGVFVPSIATDDPASVEAVYTTSNKWNGATYNGSGDVTGYGGSAYVYDGEHRLRTVSTPGQPAVTYAYDALGRRMWKDVGGARTVYVYDAFGRLALEVGGTGQVGTSYLFQDMLGSTRLITDKNGNELRRIDYYPFGREIPQGMNGRTGTLWSMAGYPAAPDLAAQKFTGKERDAETGLDYFGARYLSSAQGRFTSPDEPLIDQQPEDPQSWNLYGYVRNNPLRFTDPTGQACVVRSDGSEYNDDSGGQSCADVNKENKNPKPSATVTGEPGNVVTALGLNTFFALDNAANGYFRFLTDAMGVQPSYMQNTPTNEGVTGNVAAAGVFVGTALNPRGLLTNTRTNLLKTAQNPKLRNIIDALYRPGATVGTGSTADAIRYELQTGILLSPKGHVLKGIERRTALQKLYRDPSLGASDRQIVKQLLIDLQSGLSGR